MSEGSGTRSSLAFEYARLVDELRPRVILWENVPGVLSSSGGRDFLAFQRSLVDRGYCLAYRVLDAQHTRVDSAPRAVPQRRKRVWLVGCLGGDGRVPAQILFERPGVLGDTAPRREAGQGFAAPAGYGPARDDRVVAGAGVPFDIQRRNPPEYGDSGAAHTLAAHTVMDAHAEGLCVVAAFENHGQDSRVRPTDVSDTRSGKDGTGGNNLPLVVAIEGDLTRPSHMGSGVSTDGASFTLQAREAATKQHSVAVRTANTNANGHGIAEEASHTLDRANWQAVDLRHFVRRLTPGECETLQFFPQGWTRIPYRGKPASECPDSPRYKALGNSWATNCAEWILLRIVAAFRLDMI